MLIAKYITSDVALSHTQFSLQVYSASCQDVDLHAVSPYQVVELVTLPLPY